MCSWSLATSALTSGRRGCTIASRCGLGVPATLCVGVGSRIHAPLAFPAGQSSHVCVHGHVCYLLAGRDTGRAAGPGVPLLPALPWTQQVRPRFYLCAVFWGSPVRFAFLQGDRTAASQGPAEYPRDWGSATSLTQFPAPGRCPAMCPQRRAGLRQMGDSPLRPLEHLLVVAKPWGGGGPAPLLAAPALRGCQETRTPQTHERGARTPSQAAGGRGWVAGALHGSGEPPCPSCRGLLMSWHGCSLRRVS